ncbi:MAG: siderophore biosynthesis protein PvsA [Gammaproteobacteria bacterium]|nr:MAG: siderophore biosynthesis protein PvsA [Gammaproteobacteria bacterium]
MAHQLALITHILHPAVVNGFLPAAMDMGYEVVLVTDRGLEHKKFFVDHPQRLPARIIECDVFNPIAVIEALDTQGVNPSCVFSNSDHLQTVTALVANYFALPGKSWTCCYRAKNKSAMRNHLRELGLPSTQSLLLWPGQGVPESLPCPVVAKPHKGAASQDVQLCRTHGELAEVVKAFHRHHPASPLLLEGYLEGPLFTLETLGDGTRIEAVGGFDVRLSEEPHFVELEAVWNGEVSMAHRHQALAQVEAFGVNFGVCHSEFIATPTGPRLVEINYRSIGDGREFLLDRLLPSGWFKPILQVHAGQPLREPPSSQQRAIIRYLPARQEGTLVHIDGDFESQRDGITRRFRALKQVGDEIRLHHSNRDYLGEVTAIGPADTDLASGIAALCDAINWRIAP